MYKIMFGALLAVISACSDTSVRFLDSLDTAKQQAESKNKPILVDFYSPT